MKKGNSVLYLLIAGFFVLLVLPTANTLFNFFEAEELHGEYCPKEKPTISFDDWFNGQFQSKYESWLEENIGFRRSLIRINNQILFSIFKESKANGVFIGEDNVLYQNGYFRSCMGQDFVGAGGIVEGSRKTAFLQQKLAEKNIPFLFVLAPGKVTTYPEFLPAEKQSAVPGPTNNKEYAKEFEKNGINCIDFNEVFAQIKDTTPYPLFPKGGIHWTGNAVAHAADTIFRRLDQLSDFNLAAIEISEGYSTSKEFVYTDNDLEKLMNLVLPLEAWELHYPKVNFVSSEEQKPKILVVGDSFAQSFFWFQPYYSSLFADESRFWHDYHFGFWAIGEEKHFYPLDKSNLVDIVESFDMVMVLTAEINMSNLGLGFVDDLYQQYVDPIELDYSYSKTLGFLDFEDSKDIERTSLSPSQQDSTSGMYASQVNAEEKYSKGFEFYQSELDLVEDQINLVISLKYLIDSISNEFENECRLAIKITGKEESEDIDYRSWDLRTGLTAAGEWNNKTVRYSAEVPDEEFMLKIYVYNKGDTPMLIDNFKLVGGVIVE